MKYEITIEFPNEPPQVQKLAAPDWTWPASDSREDMAESRRSSRAWIERRTAAVQRRYPQAKVSWREVWA